MPLSESLAVFNRRARKRYGSFLPYFVNALNAGQVRKEQFEAFNQEVNQEAFLQAGFDSPYLKSMSKDILAMRKHNEKETTYTNVNGKTVVIRKNLTRIIKY